LVTLVGLITISVSTYMILYSHLLYERLAPWLSIFERKTPQREIDSQLDENVNVDVLLIGLGRYGAALAASLRERGYRLLAVDFDPDSIQRHSREGYRVHYGDAEDPEFVATLPLTRIQWVVSTVRDRSINRMLLHALRQQNYRGNIAITTYNQQDACMFEQEGVDMVLMPYTDAAREAASRLMSGPVADDHQTGDKT
jgi:Trk K+ transport system NAD-binding subunit